MSYDPFKSVHLVLSIYRSINLSFYVTIYCSFVCFISILFYIYLSIDFLFYVCLCNNCSFVPSIYHIVLSIILCNYCSFILSIVSFYPSFYLSVCLFISIQDYLYSAFYDTIVAKQLYRKLSFYNRFIYCRNLIYLTCDTIWLILYIVWVGIIFSQVFGHLGSFKGWIQTEACVIPSYGRNR